jgi:hypothetical protein
MGVKKPTLSQVSRSNAVRKGARSLRLRSEKTNEKRLGIGPLPGRKKTFREEGSSGVSRIRVSVKGVPETSPKRKSHVKTKSVKKPRIKSPRRIGSLNSKY